MLILGRHVGEKILIGDDITIVVYDIQRDYVRIGIEAPRVVQIIRSELEGRYDGDGKPRSARNAD